MKIINHLKNLLTRNQLFKDGPRISEVKQKFDLSEVIIREKNNFA